MCVCWWWRNVKTITISGERALKSHTNDSLVYRVPLFLFFSNVLWYLSQFMDLFKNFFSFESLILNFALNLCVNRLFIYEWMNDIKNSSEPYFFGTVLLFYFRLWLYLVQIATNKKNYNLIDYIFLMHQTFLEVVLSCCLCTLITRQRYFHEVNPPVILFSLNSRVCLPAGFSV